MTIKKIYALALAAGMAMAGQAEPAAAGTYTQLHAFAGGPSDGAYPAAAFVNMHGWIWSVTSGGGSYNEGAAYQIVPWGAAVGDLYNDAWFGAKPGEGTDPQSLLRFDGKFYGTSALGGDRNGGNIFRMNKGGVKESMHYFKGGSDGLWPTGALIWVGDTIYGVTSAGGGGACSSGTGCGTVFSFTPQGDYQVLYTFKGGTDGAQPVAGLTYYNGMLYGVTREGGTNGCHTGCGTVFSLTLGGAETVLHRFNHNDRGITPLGGLLPIHDVLYGTTSRGGAYGGGTVFAITPKGDYRVIYSFGTQAGDGMTPVATLTDFHSVLYGTTSGGGTNNAGTIFSLTRDGTETVQYSFAGGTDGATPHGPMMRLNGMLFGTTLYGGGAGCNGGGCGTVFSYTP